jgi:hypothetical protein
VLAAIIVSVYAGSSLPTYSFPTAFNFGEPAVLTQNWNSASVWLATAVALGLAIRPARVGRLAEPPGRVADRGLQPDRGLGCLAEILTRPDPAVTHVAAGLKR